MTFRISVSGWLPMGGTESHLQHRTRQKTPCSGKKGRRPDRMRQSQLRVAHTALILVGKRRSYDSLPPRRDRKTVRRSSEVCRCRRGEGEEVKRIHALTHWTGRRTSSSNFTSGFRILLYNTMPPWLDAIPIVPSAKCQFPAGVSSPN